jgi:hypothetical protein
MQGLNLSATAWLRDSQSGNGLGSNYMTVDYTFDDAHFAYASQGTSEGLTNRLPVESVQPPQADTAAVHFSVVYGRSSARTAHTNRTFVASGVVDRPVAQPPG